MSLLQEPDKKPVQLNSLMSNIAEGASDFVGDTLGVYGHL